MKKFAALITKHYKKILLIYIILSVINGFLCLKLQVNYDLKSYLPDDVESTVALDIMDKEFTSTVPNARVVLPNVTVAQALDAKKTISEVDGVTAVIWLDDLADVKKPLPFIDKALLDEYFKDGTAQFSVTLEDGKEIPATDKIRELLGDDVMLSGLAVQNAYIQRQILKEMIPAVSIIVPIGLFLLALTTTSWMLPMLILLVLGIAILLNMGLSALMGRPMSFITQATAPILQMAVSMDYLIFLTNSFERHRKTCGDVNIAMQRAIEESSTSIAASALTTIFGFLALMFMRFGIGIDLGLNLAKGVIFSYICALTLFPPLILYFLKLIDKTSHKRIMPELPNIGGKVLKLRIPMLILALLLVVPCFIAKDKTDFLYGNGNPGKTHQFYLETQKINEIFGENITMVIVTPKGDLGTQAQLTRELEKIPHVNSIISYSTAVGTQIPDVLVPSDTLALLQSENYSRIILTTDTEEEGYAAFKTVDSVREACAKYYKDYWVCGQSTSIRDMKTVITNDSPIVNGVAIGFVFLTLLLSFKSLTLPFILLFAIENAIWVNLSIPYFRGTCLVYLGYMIINTVQLGATIDYAILITDGYISARKKMSAYDAVKDSLNHHLISVATSAAVLTSAGFSLQASSSMAVVSALGRLLAIGTILSFSMVVFVLPALLIIADPLTQKLTLKRALFKSAKEPSPAFEAAAPFEPASQSAAGIFEKSHSLIKRGKKEPELSESSIKTEPENTERKNESGHEYREYRVSVPGSYLPSENAIRDNRGAKRNIVYVEDEGELKAMTPDEIRPAKLYYFDPADLDSNPEKEAYNNPNPEPDSEDDYIKEITAFVRNISSELGAIREDAAKTRIQNDELKKEIQRLKSKSSSSPHQSELLAELRDLNSQLSSFKSEINSDNQKTNSK